MSWRDNRDFESAKPGMDYAYFTITPWIETIQMDAGDGKYEIVVLVRVRNHDVPQLWTPTSFKVSAGVPFGGHQHDDRWR